MAGDLPVIIGETRYLQLADETTWGVATGLTFVDTPVTDYTVRYKPKNRSGQSRVGTYQEKFSTNVSGHPVGNLVTPLYYQTGQSLMDWGFGDIEQKFPRSKSAKWQYAGHEDDKLHSGLRVNQATLSGSESGISVSLELIGQTAANITGTGGPPDDRKKLSEFLFEDAVISVNGTALSVSAFSWTCQRSLDVIYNNSHSPVSLPQASHKEAFSVTPLKADASWDALRNAGGMSEHSATIVLTGLKVGTVAGGWSTLTITLPRISLLDSDESGGRSAIMNPLTFKVLKPDGTGNMSTMAWT
jgi:hypothetical protein